MRGFRSFPPIFSVVLPFLLAACAAVPPAPVPVPPAPAPPAVEPERSTTEAAKPADPQFEVPPVEEPPAILPELPVETDTPSMEFEENAAIAPVVQPGIGILAPAAASRLTPASSDALTVSFRDAWVETLFRGNRIIGAYGGDKAHDWKAGDRGCWVQNWRDAEGRGNAWGLKGLVLAIRPYARTRTFVLSGDALDAYGRGEGRGGGNGIAGYGAPLTDPYPVGDGIAVRFELGLLEIAADGTRRFTMGEPPSAFLEMPADTGAGPDPDAGRSAAFRSGWLAAVDSGLPAGPADGAVEFVAMPEAGVMQETVPVPAETPAALVAGVLFQSFAGGAWALALPVGKGVGSRARLLSGPFLRAFRSGGSWLSGLERYGAPLTDPYRASARVEQRFSKGIARADSRE